MTTNNTRIGPSIVLIRMVPPKAIHSNGLNANIVMATIADRACRVANAHAPGMIKYAATAIKIQRDPH